MPIYEYVCMECESHFEELVRGEQQVTCPDCSSEDVSRQFSTFAVHGASKPARVGGVSPDSPVGQALLGKGPGDEIEVEAPRGRWRARVVSVGRAS